jgi:hypothetical protein
MLSYFIEASGSNGDVCDLYSGNVRFESQLKHCLSGLISDSF